MTFRSPAPELPRLKTPAEDFAIEVAIEREWSALRAGLDPVVEAQVIKSFGELRARLVRVAPASGDPLGIRAVHSRYDAVEAVAEAWGVDMFQGTFGGPPPAATLVEAGANEPFRFALAISAAKETLDKEYSHSITGEDPRVILGRIYNQVIRPDVPLEWVQILLQSTQAADIPGHGTLVRRFISAVNAVAPHVAEELISLARESVKRQFTRFTPSDSTKAPVMDVKDTPGVIELRQVIGRSIAGGIAEGVVHRPGRTDIKDGFVLVCNKFVPELRDELESAVALVESEGAGFGLGAVTALALNIPHIYAATDALMLPEGEKVLVNASTRLVIRPGQD